jgi:hypothetical protein
MATAGGRVALRAMMDAGVAVRARYRSWGLPDLNLMRQIHIASGLLKDARINENRRGALKALRMATIDGYKPSTRPRLGNGRVARPLQVLACARLYQKTFRSPPILLKG